MVCMCAPFNLWPFRVSLVVYILLQFEISKIDEKREAKVDFGLTQCVLYIDTLLIDCGCTFVCIALYVWTIDGHLHTILSVSSCRC